MKQRLPYYLLVLLLSVTACDKSDFDTLTGQWQMRTQTLPDGTSYRVDTLFYNFDMGVFSLQEINDTEYYFGTYELGGGLLDMEVKSLRVMPEDSVVVYPYWGDGNHRVFNLDKLNSSTLQLSYNDTIYLFRKF